MARPLPGHDLTQLLAKGAAAGPNDLRAGSLFCFNMFLSVDSDYLRSIQAYLNAGGDLSRIAEQGFMPDLRKRGALRSVFDGRYKFTRYFSPREHNQPKTLEDIIDQTIGKVFDYMGVEHELFRRWGEKKDNENSRKKKTRILLAQKK